MNKKMIMVGCLPLRLIVFSIGLMGFCAGIIYMAYAALDPSKDTTPAMSAADLQGDWSYFISSPTKTDRTDVFVDRKNPGNYDAYTKAKWKVLGVNAYTHPKFGLNVIVVIQSKVDKHFETFKIEQAEDRLFDNYESLTSWKYNNEVITFEMVCTSPGRYAASDIAGACLRPKIINRS